MQLPPDIHPLPDSVTAYVSELDEISEPRAHPNSLMYSSYIPSLLSRTSSQWRPLEDLHWPPTLLAARLTSRLGRKRTSDGNVKHCEGSHQGSNPCPHRSSPLSDSRVFRSPPPLPLQMVQAIVGPSLLWRSWWIIWRHWTPSRGSRREHIG